MERSFNKPPRIASYDLPPRLCREIGRIMIRWAYLEHYIQGICYMLLDVTGAMGRVAIREPRLPDRLEMIAELVHLRGLSIDTSLIDGLRKEADDPLSMRDLVAHGAWTYAEDAQEWAVQVSRGKWPNIPKSNRHAAKKRITPEGLLIDCDSLRIISSDIDQLIRSARNLQREIEAALGA